MKAQRSDWTQSPAGIARRWIVVMGLSWCGMTTSWAQIRTDGTAGAAQTLSGPAFVIPQSLGTVAGSNLFHSFSSFNVSNGQSATFTTTSALSHVIARVTGGGASSIDGLVRLTAISGSQPGFWLINPAGVVFGANSRIQVPGAFHVGTADYIRLGDDRFYADARSGSTFSSAAPQAFGFLGGHSGVLSLDGATLSNGRNNLTLAAGEIELQAANLITSSGDIRLAAVGSTPIEVPITGDALTGLTGAMVMGQESGVTTESTALASGGTIYIMAGRLVMNEASLVNSHTVNSTASGTVQVTLSEALLMSGASQIGTSTEGEGPAGNVTVRVSGPVELREGSAISSMTYDAGPSGRVVVDAYSLLGDGTGAEAGYTGIFAQTDGGTGQAGGVSVTVATDLTLTHGAGISSSNLNASEGNAGSVNVTVGGHLQVLSGSEISSDTSGAGHAGTVTVQAASARLDSQGVTAVETGIYSEAYAGTGASGHVQVSVEQELRIAGQAYVSSSTYTDADAGTVRVQAGSLWVGSGSRKDSQPGIFSDTYRGAGHAGEVTVQVRDLLEMSSYGMISSTTYAQGNAGVVTVTAGRMVLDGTGADAGYTGIFAQTDGGTGQAGGVSVTVATDLTLTHGAGISSSNLNASEGNAGSVNVTVGGHLQVLTGSEISSDTSGAGHAGTVTVQATSAGIDAQEVHDMSTGVTSATYALGAAGSVNVSVSHLEMSGDSAMIGAQAYAGSSGRVGQVTVNASELTIRDGAAISIANDAQRLVPWAGTQGALHVVAGQMLLLESPNAITARSTGNLPAASVWVEASRSLSLQDSAISTTAQDGDGGAITIQTPRLILSRSRLQTSVLGLSGNGGNILVEASDLLLRNGFIQANTAARDARGGDIHLAVLNLVPEGNTLYVGGDEARSFEPWFGFNLIQAASPAGLSGTIGLTTPALDLTSALAGLGSTMMVTAGLGRTPCDRQAGSALILAGRGGTPASPRQWWGPQWEIPQWVESRDGTAGRMASDPSLLSKAHRIEPVPSACQ